MSSEFGLRTARQVAAGGVARVCADRVDSINRDLIRSLESHIRGVTNSGTVVLVQALEQLMPSLQGLCADLAAYGEWLANVDRIAAEVEREVSSSFAEIAAIMGGSSGHGKPRIRLPPGGRPGRRVRAEEGGR